MSALRLAAVILAVSLVAGGARATTMAADPVLFQGVFPTPLVDAAALRSAAGARFSARLHVVNNSREPIRLARTATVTPELVGLRGEPVPAGPGATAGLARGEGTLAPGQALAIVVSGRLRLSGGQLRWEGDDGSGAAWKLDPAQRYSLRLRYQAEDAAGWRGVGLTHAVTLPVN